MRRETMLERFSVTPAPRFFLCFFKFESLEDKVYERIFVSDYSFIALTYLFLDL